MMNKLFLVVILSAFAAVSCGTYHAGVSLPEDQRNIALEQVKNISAEAALTPLFKNAFIQRLESTTGIRTNRNADKADLAVSVKIMEVDQKGVANAYVRDKSNRDKDSEAYQTVLFRMEVVWEYNVTVVKTNAVLAKGQFVTQADIPLMPDLEMARRAALKEAARSAAEKLTWIITER